MKEVITLKILFMYLKENRIYLSYERNLEVIFDLEKYRDVIDNAGIDKYPFFLKIHNEYGIKDKEFIKNNFLPLFNFILSNNLANYIMDKIFNEEYEINFEDPIEIIQENIVKLTGTLTLHEMYNNIFNILMNYNKESKEKVKINNKQYEKNDRIEHKKLEEIFYYSPIDKEELKQKLNTDLVAFNYVEQNSKNQNNRYVLPVYIDYETLKQKGIEAVDDFIKNWESIAYLKMITKIHDYFIDYYNLKFSKGFHNDILTTALFEMFDSEIRPYPKNLKKSIEVGRATSGKCFFIDKVESPVPISVDLALILQGRDVYSVVTKVSKYK